MRYYHHPGSGRRMFKVTDLLWPLLMAFFSVGIYLLLVLVLFLINLLVRSDFFGGLVRSLFNIWPIILALSLVSSYANHFRKISGLGIIVPLLSSLSVTLILWFISFIFIAIDKYAKTGILTSIFQAVDSYIILLFFIVLVVSYIVYFARKADSIHND